MATMAWWVTLGCLIYSAHLANTFLARSPRLYAVLALFSLKWALLLPFYGGMGQSESFIAYSSFLFIFIGGLLAQEARHRDRNQADDADFVSLLQRRGLWLLVFLATPHFAFPISSAQAEKIVALGLTAVGFVSAAYGIYRLAARWAAWMVIIVLGLYGALEVSFAALTWNGAPMSAPFYYAFAVAKIVQTIAITSPVVYEGMKPEVQREGWIGWVLRFIGLRALAESIGRAHPTTADADANWLRP
jgi:hypothetical protein